MEVYLKICEKIGMKLHGIDDSGWEWWMFGYSIFNPYSRLLGKYVPWTNSKATTFQETARSCQAEHAEQPKTTGFFILCLELRKKSFQHSCQIDAVSHLIRP